MDVLGTLASGTCGENLTWTLDSDGTLTISGTGDMRDYYYGNAPWYSSRSSVTTVVIEDGVTSIGNYAFYDCSSLTSITIPEGVTSIGDYAFYGCSSLTSIMVAMGNVVYHSAGNCLIETASKTLITGCSASTIPDDGSVTSIGDGAFYGCRSLTSITIPEGVTSIGDWAFDGCRSLTSITIPEGVTNIGDSAFRDCSKLTSVNIPEGVTSIGDWAFCDCSKLTSITIPESVTSIGEHAFSECSSLTSITIPEGVKSVGDYAFSECSSLTSITLPEGVTSIGDYAFEGCSSLTSITLPEGVTSIGDYAFEGCSSLTSITLPEGVTSIGSYAFSGCSGLTSVTLPEGVTSIGSYAFSGCSRLTSITLPEGVTSIGDYAFYKCSSLTSITIPEGVTSIGDSAFSGCSGLTSVTIPEGVTSIGYSAFSGCSGLTSVTIPEGVTSIGFSAFNRCSSLTNITIPDGVTSIREYAFNGCSSLTSITIPEGVTSIGYSAFYSCSSLTDVYYSGTQEQWDAISIGSSNTYLTSATIHIYSAVVTAPTCTEKGYTIHTCTACGDSYVDTYVDAIGHTEAIDKAVEPTCTKTGLTAGKHCSVCNEVLVEQKTVDATGHTEVIDEAVAPTCTKTGLTEGKHCSVCNKVLVQQKTVSATGHTEVIDEAVAPTCTETGLTEGKHCSVCNEVLVAQETVAAKGHTEVIDKAVAPTCTETGLTEGKHCSVCNEVLVVQESVPANGHSYEAVATDPTCTEQGYTTHTCTACGDSYVDTYVDALGHDVTLVEAAEPTYFELGNYEYYQCERCEMLFSDADATQETTLEEQQIPKLDSVATGSCGADLKWVLTDDGVLTISGTGNMINYSYGQAPWYSNRSSITTVVIESGVTSIGTFAFHECENLTNVTIPASVSAIGSYAFLNCSDLTSITLTHRATDALTIGTDAFYLDSYSYGDMQYCPTVVQLPSTKRVPAAVAQYDWKSSYRSVRYYGTMALPVQSLSLRAEVTEAEVGTAVPVQVTVEPADTTSDILWSVIPGTGRATVTRNGVVAGVTAGTVTVRATSGDDETIFAELALTILPPTGGAPTTITVTTGGMYENQVAVGQTVPMLATFTPANTSNRTLKWEVENVTGSATIDANGNLTGLTPGKVTVWAEGANEVTGSCSVDVVRYADQVEILLDGKTEQSLGVGEKRYLTAALSPEDTTTQAVTWSVVNGTGSAILESESRYSNGGMVEYTWITGKKAGTVTLLAIANDSKAVQAKLELEVTDTIRSYSVTGGNIYYNTKTGYITGCDSQVTAAMIPARIDGTTIVGIGADAFANTEYSYAENNTLSTVSVPATVREIGNRAFYNCKALTSVRFTGTSQLTTVGERAFYGCNALANLTIPSRVSHVGSEAFSGLSGLKNLTLSGELDTTNSDITYYTLESITYTGSHVRSGVFCRAQKLILSDSIVSVAENAFNFSEASRVDIGANVSSIGDYAFDACYNLTDVYYGDTQKQWSKLKIGKGNWCLTNANIHYTSGDPDCYAKGTCGESLIWYLDVSGVLTISGTGSMKHYTSAKNVPWYSHRSRIQKVVLSEGVTSISDYAFNNCSNLTGITITGTVTGIGAAAFSGCSSLTEVHYEGNMASWAKVTVGENNDDLWNATLYCVDDDGKAYTIAQSGTCGDALVWMLSDNGELILSGTGAMASYSSSQSAPWYAYRDSITSVLVAEGVTSIENYAFHNCANLTSVTIPGTVTKIGENAFPGCKKLTRITVADRNTCYRSKGNCLIETKNKTLLFVCADAVIPEDGSVAGIGEYAFCQRSDLTSIRIPKSVTSISASAFSGCTSLTSVTVASGNPAYQSKGNCLIETESKTLLLGFTTSVIPGDGTVTRIGNSAFSGCSDLKSINIPGTITEIGEYAFQNCKNLKDVYFGDSITNWLRMSIESGNSNLTAATLHCVGSDGTSHTYNFGACGSKLNWALDESGVLTISGTGDMDSYNYDTPCRTAIKTAVLEEGITSIDDHAFYGCSNLTSITIPESVTSIGYSAFRDCSSLTSITIPESVTSIGDRTFMDCSSLTSITIPDGVTYIDQSVFWGCSSLSSITIPESVTSIGGYAFKGCSSLTSITIPESVTSIGGYAFEGCSSLSSITIPESVTSISYSAFRNCSSLTSITIPEKVSSIGNYVFYGCSSLTSITIPEKVRSIGNYVFYGCSSLTSITIPEKVSSIGSYAFYGCSSLTSITIPKEVSNIPDYTFSGCSSLTSITMLGNVSSIGKNAFSGCDSLTDVTYGGSRYQWDQIAMGAGNGALTGAQLHTLPNAAELSIDQGDSLMVDMWNYDPLSLTATVTPAESYQGVTWSSSDETVLKVDKNGVLKPLKVGTAEICATTTDGTGLTDTISVTVYYVDTANELTATVDVPEIGLQPGQKAQITIQGNTVLPAEAFYYTIPEKQQEIAWVNYSGIITGGEKAGTVTVTAAIRNDPLNRKVTVRVKVIPLRAMGLTLTPAYYVTVDSHCGEPQAILNAKDVDTKTYSFPVNVRALKHDGWYYTPDVTWVSSNPSIATVKTDKYGDTTVTVKKGASGECFITATVKDQGKVSANLWIAVRDYQPRLESNSLSMNLYQSSSVNVALLESYDNAITGVSVDGGFGAKWEDGILTITAPEDATKGTYTQTLTVTCGEGKTSREYEYTLKIKLKETAPAVTIKQSGKYNLFYNDGTATLSVTAKGEEVESVTVLEGDFYEEFDRENGTLTLTAKGEGTPGKKVTLEIEVAGWEKPVEKTVTLATVTTAPKLKLSSTSSTINTNYGDQSTTFQVLSGTEVLNLADLDVTYSGDFAEYSVDGNGITLTLNDTKGGTATLLVQDSNWTKSVKLTHKVTVQTALPALKLGATALKLNRVFPELGAQTRVSLSHGNLSLYDLEITSTAKEGSALADEAEKLSVDWDGENGITATILDDTIKTGTYSFRCEGMLDDDTALKPVTLKITVSSSNPKVKLAATTFKLNRNLAGEEYVSTKVTVPAGYTLVGFEGGEEFFSYDEGYLTACLNGEEDVGGSYTIYPMLIPDGCEETITLTSGLKVKVTPYTAKVTATVTTKGKLDVLNPSSAITCTVKLKNCTGTVSGVSLSGQDSDMFEAEVQNGKVIVTMLDGAEYATNKSYKVTLDMVACGQDVSAGISFKVNQSTLKLTFSPSSVTYYQALGQVSTVLKCTSPVTAEIADVTLSTKTASAFRKALGENEMQFDPDTGRITFTFAHPGLLAPGKSYTVYLDVTPQNAATNVKPTQIKLTVKVQK